MKPNLARVWLGLIGAGAVTMAVFFMMGGALSPTTGAIQIDFSIDEKGFAGLEVEIDGEAAGRLKPFGALMRSGFEVEEGAHTVRVLHPEYRCEPSQVEVVAGQRVLLLLGYETSSMSQYTSETVLVLQR